MRRSRLDALHGARGNPGQPDLVRALECFWHPVCRAAELAVEAARPVAARLLGHDLAIARLADGRLTALDDRCAHRSTRLSIGRVEGCTLECAHHGWRWAADGSCAAIPAMPDATVPARARVPSHAVTERAGLVWVRLDAESTIPLPPCPAWDDPALSVASGEPYDWAVAAPRRVEDFVDPARLGWLGRAPGTGGIPPQPDVERIDGEVRFHWSVPFADGEVAAACRIAMPGTVHVEALLPSGRRRVVWLAVSPVDDERSRTFWLVAGDDEATDADRLAAADRAFADDEPAVTHQVPAWFPLDAHEEVSVRTDLVSNVYRRWLREIVAEVKRGGAAAAVRSLGHPVARTHDAAS